jgi:hypothetical protein
MVKKYLNLFWNDIMNKLDEDQIVLLLFRVKLGDENDPDIIGNYSTIGKLFKINNSSDDFNKLYEILKELLDVKDETYKNLPLQKIAFSYKIVAKDNTKIISNTKPKLKTYQFKGYNLPNTMNLKLWGSILTVNLYQTVIKKKGSKFLYEVESIEDSNELIYNVKMILPSKEVMLTFKDVKNINDPINTFTRYIGLRRSK